MRVQAVVTKFVGPSLRIHAIAPNGQLRRSYNRNLTPQENHLRAAVMLAHRLGWQGRCFQGGSEAEGGLCFVWLLQEETKQ